jgi:hypothetical protein
MIQCEEGESRLPQGASASEDYMSPGVARRGHWPWGVISVGLVVGALALCCQVGPAGAVDPVVLFAPPSTFAVGFEPADVTAADLDADGSVDLISACRGADSVSILWGSGSGTFPAALRLPAGRGPISVRTGDLDHNGYPDIVVADFDDDSGSVTVLKNLGGRAFAPGQKYRTGANASSVILADVNGDGYLDIVSVNMYGNSITVLLNDGHGGGPQRVDVASPNQPMSVAAADLNGDGNIDLVVDSWYGVLRIFLGNGDGTFQSPTAYGLGLGHSVVLADMNGDGKLDAVCGGNTYGVNVLLGDGQGEFGSPSYFQSTRHGEQSVETVGVADLNNDGKPDAVCMSYCCVGEISEVAVLLGAGDGTLRSPQYFPTGVGPRGFTIQDLNKDGWADLAVVASDSTAVCVFLNETRLTPVELSELEAEVGDGFVALRWSVYAEGASGQVQVSRASGLQGPFEAISGPMDVVPSEHGMSYRDAAVQPDRDYFYRVTLGDATQGPLHVRTAPARLALSVATSNPFRGATELRYSLPADGRVRLDLLDAQGRRVRRLLDEPRPAGWSRLSVDASDLATGVYFARLEAHGAVRSTRLVVLK